MAWIDISKAGQLTRGDKIEWDLARREEVVSAKIELHAKGFTSTQRPRVVCGDVIALVAERTLEWPIGARTFVGKERIRFLQGRAVSKECPGAAKRPTL